MSGPRRILIFGGLVHVAVGMSYGLYFAVFLEHQALGGLGGALAQGFVDAAQRQLPQAHAAIDAYAATKYGYVRQVDVHSHWIGLGMILIALGAAFDYAALSDRIRSAIAGGLLAGSFLFPLGVLLQTVSQGEMPKALAILGSGLVIVSMAAVAYGFIREGAADVS